jgi:predicted NBD/HSP70 family sugar kinase
MGQTTFDDDELLSEATDETRATVEEHLAAAREELPTADAVWETDADNVLGALNGLSAALDTDDAAESLRQAKKEYLLGQQAGVFDEDDELGAELESVADLLTTLQTAHEQVGELTSTVPQLRSGLQEAHASAGSADDAGEADEADGAEA